jgi:hypothetical protein
MVRRHRLLVPIEALKLPAEGYPLPSAEAPPKALRRRARTALSRVTTGREILPGIDWRTATARRYQDIVARIAADQGGANRLSEVRLQLVRRYAGGAVLAEAMEAKLAKGEPIDISQYALLASMVERETASSFDLSNSTTIEIHSASHRSTRGYTIIAALCDELAFWPTEDSAEPDYEVIRALRPGMATIPGAMLLCGSSPYARRGALWDSYRRHFGRDDDPVLVWQAATRTMNPSVPQSLIDEETERDPASAAAEYGAQFRVDVESFVAREVVDAAVAQGRHELPPVQGVGYRAFVDPSGGSADSMTLAVAHRDRTSGNVVLDAVRERKPPFSPEAVVDEFCALLLQYGLRTVTGDRYAGEWPRERFHVHGVTYEPSEPPKSDIYRDVLPLLNAGRVELLDLPRLASQLCGLERRTARGGRDSIDHAPGGHDDLANAACGALRLCAGVTDAEQWAAFGRSHGTFGFSHRHAITMSSI